ncbi:transglycosylase domain-containing protein [Donghicola tyrosinivorans]|uniref:Transglycosylase n=1 Tax=Donghicola tyrosinivorans TaxID=1652492 RepID=A0A2T0WQ76_9RHOB|nr:transglycosylase domain-containing protein [Donghicola tyrosinivorans]PRY88840.1 transglycosylase [Donghicola tyrosinivorans]
MARVFKFLILVLAALTAALAAYGGKGYFDAKLASDDLRIRANQLIAEGRSGAYLGAERLNWLLRVQDPAFRDHSGVDFSTAGAGATTISQSVSKRLAFKHFEPGIGKVRQTGYALGLEQSLTKDQILALWLGSVEMGRGPDGWMTGFFEASIKVFGVPPSETTDTEYLRLVAVLIAPASFDLRYGDEKLVARTARIERMFAGECAPLDHGDVWLEGCR